MVYPADIHPVTLFSSNRQFFNEIVTCISKIVLPHSLAGIAGI